MLGNYSAHLFTPQTCPFQWCAHLWGCRWGIGGCYPSRMPSLVLAPGWWPGGLIPYLKDVGYRYRGVQPDGDRDCLSYIFLHILSHILQGGGLLLRPPAHVRATGPPLLPGTAPLLGRGPLTCTLQGPFHLHTWTLAMKTPHWSLLGGAPGPSRSRGRPPMRGPGGAPHGRCQPARGARAGEGGGGGGAVGRGGGTEWLREVVHGGH